MGSERASTDAQAARAAALSLLARRDHSRAELAGKLVDKGFQAATIATVADALEREKLLDDARYAEHYVVYHAGRGQGPIRIGRELRQTGISAELIDRVLAEGQDWVAAARRVRQKKFGRTEPGSYAEKAKQARFLHYRGFTGAQIRQALGTDINSTDIDSTDIGLDDDPT